MNQKGQGAIELLIISVVILIVSIMVLGLLNDFNDSTVAVSILKAETINELDNYNQAFWIKSIDFEETDNETIVFDIILAPKENSSINLGEIKTKLEAKIQPIIASKTKYTNVSIKSILGEASS